MRVQVYVDISLPQGDIIDAAKARWTNNKVTAQIADLIEHSAIGQVRQISTREVAHVVTTKGDGTIAVTDKKTRIL